jgi:ParB family chromosome partitioning protein
MSRNRGAWISRRGQAGAEAAIDQVIDRQPQSGEQVQQLPDERIEDSPYQARQPFSDDSVEDLAQGMREAGFQGVLIVRPHGDLAKRRRGVVQLVYGHRRRIAWRQVCAEHGAPCLLPVVTREVSDAQLLTIGAQENLQRHDLDPIEEAQIVAWHERMFFDKNQAEIGAMLGKSSDWVSVRSRIHKLPDGLKDRIRRRPRAISQILELGSLYAQQPDAALALADRVVHENLTLDTIRTLVRGYARPGRRESSRAESIEHRGTAIPVQEITDDLIQPQMTRIRDKRNERRGTATAIQAQATDERPILPLSSAPADRSNPAWRGELGSPPAPMLLASTDRTLLQEAADALTFLASRADHLIVDTTTEQALDRAESALRELRRSFDHRASETQIDPTNAD